MSEPFLAEIRIVGFNFPPRGWAQCDGQVLPINQNQALFSLLGTTYGGDGRTTFALPDLRSRTPVHPGPDIRLGARGGEETHVLTTAEMPNHDHTLRAASAAASAPVITGGALAANPSRSYGEPANLVALAADSVGSVGAGQGHENMQPYTTLNYVIALQGLFPSRN